MNPGEGRAHRGMNACAGRRRWFQRPDLGFVTGEPAETSSIPVATGPHEGPDRPLSSRTYGQDSVEVAAPIQVSSTERSLAPSQPLPSKSERCHGCSEPMSVSSMEMSFAP